MVRMSMFSTRGSVFKSPRPDEKAAASSEDHTQRPWAPRSSCHFHNSLCKRTAGTRHQQPSCSTSGRRPPHRLRYGHRPSLQMTLVWTAVAHGHMSAKAAAACVAAAVSGSLDLMAVIVDSILMALGQDAVLDLRSRSALRCALNDISTLRKLASPARSQARCSRRTANLNQPPLCCLSGLTHLQINNCASVDCSLC